jgi:hypothetical protein
MNREPSGVNFINILLVHFLYESNLSSFYLVTNPKHSFGVFGRKILNEKRACKTLMKLTEGIELLKIEL